MKKKTTDIITTLMGLILFAFGFLAFWVDKVNGIMLIVIAAVSVGLVAFKNDKLEKLINLLLSWKK